MRYPNQLEGFEKVLDALLDRLKDGNKPYNKPDAPDIPLIDPTKNVTELVDLQVKRLIDLAKAEQLRQDNLRDMQIDYESKLSEKETRRIDALMLAAKADITMANEKAALTAANLAAAVASSAETLRLQVQSFNTSLGDRMAKVEQNQYQGVGMSQQRGEGRQQYQWLITIVVATLAAILAYIVKK